MKCKTALVTGSTGGIGLGIAALNEIEGTLSSQRDKTKGAESCKPLNVALSRG
jgi:hypothetical protein